MRRNRLTSPVPPHRMQILLSTYRMLGRTLLSTNPDRPQSFRKHFRARDFSRALSGGRYWVRTSDLFRVKEARYPCANRPFGSSAHRSGLEESYTGSEMVRARSSVTCVPPPSQNACPSPLSEQLGAHHRRLESPDIAGSHSGPPGITASPSGRLRAAGSIPPCGTGERTAPGRPRR